MMTWLLEDPWITTYLVMFLVVGGLIMAAGMLALQAWADQGYDYLWNHPKTGLDIDAFVPDSPPKKVKVFLLHRFRLGYREASLDPIPLECVQSEHVKGLNVSRKQSTGNKTDDTIVPMSKLLSSSDKTPIVIATIRMGFGHHRLAYSACSWALATGRPTIFHDLLNIESEESGLIKSTDELYSRFSRYASELGGAVEKLWGSMMLSGDADALRVAGLTANQLQPLLLGLPKDTPIISTHQLVALTAAAAGFTNVINLVVDNHPQWFLVVPKTLNLVQGPVNYQSFLQMGVASSELQWAGHWCPKELVDNIEQDCERRIARARRGFVDDASIPPRRILIPVGGAGAQRKFILSMIRMLTPFVKSNRIQLLLNAGDHVHMKTAFVQVLNEMNLKYDIVDAIRGVYDFQKELLLDNKEPPRNVTLFAFDEYFPAVATTDILCRVADVLSCKPSELAFYPIPKLHIRRVGDHEADSARRAAELGDGTSEARELHQAKRLVELMLKGPELLVQMNESVIQNNKLGVYDGCKKAVELLMERAEKKEE